MVQSKEEIKAKARERMTTPEYKAKQKLRNQRPEVKAKRKELQQTPEYKKRAREYNKTPKRRARQLARAQTTEAMAKQKIYRDRTDVKAKRHVKQSTPEFRAYRKEREGTPEYHLKVKNVRDDRRLKMLEIYSKRLSNSNIPCCNCCEENFHVDFLAIDHIAGKRQMDSEPELKRLKYTSKLKGNRLVDWIIKNNFPDGFQILCHNCNFAKGLRDRNNICPHKMK